VEYQDFPLSQKARTDWYQLSCLAAAKGVSRRRCPVSEHSSSSPATGRKLFFFSVFLQRKENHLFFRLLLLKIARLQVFFLPIIIFFPEFGSMFFPSYGENLLPSFSYQDFSRPGSRARLWPNAAGNFFFYAVFPSFPFASSALFLGVEKVRSLLLLFP